MKWIASLRKELLELARTYRLLALAIVLIIFGLLSPVTAKALPELFKLIPGGEDFAGLLPTPTMGDAITQYVKNMAQFGLLMALLLSAGSVAQEKERGTAVLVLVKPLPRSIFIGAKFVALALAFLVVLLVAGAAAYLYTLILFQAPSLGGWAIMNLMLWLYLLVIVAVTMLASALTRSQIAALGIAVGAFVVVNVVNIIPGVGKYLPGHLYNWGAVQAGLQPLAPPAGVWPALAVSLALIAGSIVAAWLIFDRQEL